MPAVEMVKNSTACAKQMQCPHTGTDKALLAVINPLSLAA
jgi:hypothetical protein